MSFEAPARPDSVKGPDASANQLHRMLMDSWGGHFKQHLKVLELLDKHPEYAWAADESGYYAAHHVCAFGGNTAVAQRICDLHPEAAMLASLSNWLPLHLAACWGNLPAARVFLRAFPEASYQRDSDGKRPIERARASGWSGLEALLEPHEEDYEEWKAAHPELAAELASDNPRRTKGIFSDKDVDMMREMGLGSRDQEDREILAKIDEEIGLAERRRAAIDEIKRRG